MEITLKNDPVELVRVTRWLQEFAAGHRLDPQVLRDLDLALEQVLAHSAERRRQTWISPAAASSAVTGTSPRTSWSPTCQRYGGCCIAPIKEA